MRDNSDNYILNLLYRGTTTVEDFNWDNMYTVPILSLMTVEDIDYLRSIILSPRYSGNNKLKMQKMDEVMNMRGFKRFAGGTNRLVYEHPKAPNAVFKVAIDSVGINDNPAEFKNQQLLKPYCTKVFECSPCGTIASFERVDRITTIDEFYTIADDYYWMLDRMIIGKFVMEDIGTKYFMNVGIRFGFGPVILDFPYLFELDGSKIFCNNELDDGTICGGEIDYDDGFNQLVCSKCGSVHRARELGRSPKQGGVFLRTKGAAKDMVVLVKRGDVVIKKFDTQKEAEYLKKELNAKNVKAGKVPVVSIHRVSITGETKPVNEHTIQKKPEAVKEAIAQAVKVKVVEKKVNVTLNKKPEEAKKEEAKPVVIAKVNGKSVADRVIDTANPIKKTTVKDVVETNVSETPVVKAEAKATVVKAKVEPKKPSTKVERLAGAKTTTSEKKTTTKVKEVAVSVGKSAKKATEEKVAKEETVKVSVSGKKATKKEVVPTEEVKKDEKEVVASVVEEPVKEEVHVEEVVEEKTTKSSKKKKEAKVVEEVAKEEEKPVEEIIEEKKEVSDETPLKDAVFFGDEEPAAVEETVVVEEEQSVEEEVVTEVPEATEETVVEEMTEADVVDEEELEYDLVFVDVVPKDAEAGTIFYVPKDPIHTDISAYEGVTDPALIDSTLFDIYTLDGDHIVKVIYNADADEEEAWEVVNDSPVFEEDVIENLKSQMKPSVSDLLR